MFEAFVGGVVGETAAGHVGKGRIGCAEGGVCGGLLLVRGFGKNVSCSSDI